MNNRNNNNNTQQVKSKSSRKNAGKGRPNMDQQALIQKLNSARLPKYLGMRGPFPTDELVHIKYKENIVMQGASPFVVVDYRLNSAYQTRVGGATGTNAGFAGSIARYLSYRVENVKIRFDVIANDSGTPATFGFLCNDTQVSTVLTTWANAQQALSNTGAYAVGSVGEIGGLSVYRSPTFDIPPSSIVGNPLLYYSDRDYTGTSTSNPNQAVWGSMIVVSDASSVNLTNGVVVNMNIELITRFFSLQVLL